MSTHRAPLAAILVLVTASALAGPPADSGGAPAAGGSSTPAAPASGSERGRGRPAETFTPSEQVGADSAVSFPVDI